jgi:methionyl-tRNA formyltransferase
MSHPVRALLIIEDDQFFYPRFVKALLDHHQIEIVGLIIAQPKSGKHRYLQAFKQLSCYRLREIFVFALLLFKMKCLALFNKQLTLSGLAEQRSIPFRIAKGSANTPVLISWVQDLNPDIIFSASPLILGAALLSICNHSVNMHFSLLPQYKGIMPLFHAVANGEKVAGISLHTMTTKIDEGKLLYQQPVPLDFEQSLFENYRRFFEIAPSLVATCLQRPMGDDIHIDDVATASYFGFPTKKDWKKFRASGMNFI